MNQTISITLQRDAGLVNELFKRSRMFRTNDNQAAYIAASNWFREKHNEEWSHWLAKEELQR